MEGHGFQCKMNRKSGTAVAYSSKCLHLEGEQDKEGNHQTEETHGFGQGKSQNGISKK